MNLTDLRIFVSAARRPTLAAAALELHLTPSAVSKALRRLEDSLGTPLFDRAARQLALNGNGRRLLARAQPLLALADQTRADIMGVNAQLACRIGGPPALLWRQGPRVADALADYLHASLRLQPLFEDEALTVLAAGDIDAAIVTGVAVAARAQHWPGSWVATPIGELQVQLVAHRAHALALLAARGAVSAQQVLEHDFASPTRSLFCGEQRGSRSDGWRDDLLPRRIRYWSDDVHLLLGFVRAGDALAYLPDDALDDPELVAIDLRENDATCREQVWLVFDGASAGDWLTALAQALSRPVRAGSETRRRTE
jgi:DNA-binding transcriptional LysR family regulator